MSPKKSRKIIPPPQLKNPETLKTLVISGFHDDASRRAIIKVFLITLVRLHH
jgi:hypothetical protein